MRVISYKNEKEVTCNRCETVYGVIPEDYKLFCNSVIYVVCEKCFNKIEIEDEEIRKTLKEPVKVLIEYRSRGNYKNFYPNSVFVNTLDKKSYTDEYCGYHSDGDDGSRDTHYTYKPLTIVYFNGKYFNYDTGKEINDELCNLSVDELPNLSLGIWLINTFNKSKKVITSE